MRSIGLKELARMRLEHHGARQSAMSGCRGACLTKQGLVPAMDAVEIPDRERGPSGIMGDVVVSVNNVHGPGDGAVVSSSSKDSNCRPEVKPRAAMSAV